MPETTYLILFHMKLPEGQGYSHTHLITAESSKEAIATARDNLTLKMNRELEEIRFIDLAKMKVAEI